MRLSGYQNSKVKNWDFSIAAISNLIQNKKTIKNFPLKSRKIFSLLIKFFFFKFIVTFVPIILAVAVVVVLDFPPRNFGCKLMTGIKI